MKTKFYILIAAALISVLCSTASANGIYTPFSGRTGGPTTGVNATPVATGLTYNPSGNSLSKFRNALYATAQGQANTTVLMIGSSTINGFFSGSGTTWDYTNNLEGRIANELTNFYGLTANDDGIFGKHANTTGSSGASSGGDTRVVDGAGWGADTIWSIGGYMAVNTTTTNCRDYTLPTTDDRDDFYYPTDNVATLGVISYQVNSGTVTNIDEGATAPGVGKVTLTVTPGANVLHICRVSGTAKFIGELPYLSTSKSVNIINSGVGGAKIADVNDASAKPYAAPTAFSAIAPDLTLLALNGNDAVSGTSDAAFKASTQSVISALTTGDVLLVSQFPYGAAGGTVANFPAKVQDYKDLALTNSLASIILSNWMVTYDSDLAPRGWSNLDGLHLSRLGYQWAGSVITDQMMTLAGISSLPTARSNPLFFFYNPTSTTLGFLAGTGPTKAGQVDASGNWTFGPDFDAVQAKINVNGAPLASGVSRSTIISRDTTTGSAAGLGGGILFQYDDAGTPRGIASIWGQKLNSTVGNTAGDVYVGSRVNGGNIVEDFHCSTTGVLCTFTDAIKTPAAITTGTKATLSGGCTSGTTHGGATAGDFISSTTGACAVTVTINGATGLTAPTGYSCFVSDSTTGVVGAQTATADSTTQASFSVVTSSGDKVHWGCIPN